MADLSINATYTLKIDAAEFRLISAALLAGGVGRVLRSDMRADALDLQNRLFAARAATVESFSENVLRQTPNDGTVPVAPNVEQTFDTTRSKCPRCGTVIPNGGKCCGWTQTAAMVKNGGGK